MEKKFLLPLEFYLENDVVKVGKDLLGKVLFTEIVPGEITGGMIVETESYAGIHDRASHAFNGRRTKRVEPMYQKGGIAYVYLCYGFHHLLNVVTNREEIPHAVLIRAIEPLYGIDLMINRRGQKSLSPSLTAGPASLTKALHITLKENFASFLGKKIWIEDRGFSLKENEIIKSQRVGVHYAKEDAFLPYRFRMKDNPYTSPAN
jgi:DNA-3-methyladenine glycosylase